MSHEYAQSFAEWGTPRQLPRCEGWLLVRSTPGGKHLDAMGLYPRFVCHDWSQLADDLRSQSTDVAPTQPAPIAVSLVSDPFGTWQGSPLDESQLSSIFTRVTPFKTHYVVHLVEPPETFISRHHRQYTRLAQRHVTVEHVEQSSTQLDAWDSLYAHLAARHHLRGIKRFSRTAFAQQLQAPGIKMFVARDATGTIIGGQLWYVHGERAYHHLAACSPSGYDLQASYALYDFALRHFRGEVQWLDLGAGAGVSSAEEDGLAWFKRGWSNATRQVYFCAQVLDQRAYDDLRAAVPTSDANYFPAYRAGEF